MSKDFQQVTTPDAPAAIGPYSQAVVAGGFVFCSGQIALEPKTGALVGDTAAQQCVRVMSNLLAVLGAAGCTFADVVKTTIYLKDMNDFGAVNEAYAAALGEHRPARATVQAARLPKDALVEIDCVARVP
ncbi:MAG: Rid family detoxifying hydrolase [Planctomycetes bacterium]|nr:Rid family detoxifying hydrolase [Planctomycetota bacterium]MCW8135463.1 Rid family detoxifying hydrolase [Planctomycetota bacterium]